MNKKVIVAMTMGGALFVGNQALASIASTVYVDRVVGEAVTEVVTDRIVPLETTVNQHTTTISEITQNITIMGDSVEGKADLAEPGTAGVIAIVGADGQFDRDASGLTIPALATHVQTQVAGAIEAAVTGATGDLSDAIDAVDGRVTIVDGRVTTLINETVTPMGQTVAGHTTAIGELGTALEGKADLAGTGTAGVIAIVGADGQFDRDASGLTIPALATHVQERVAGAIGDAVADATGDLTGLINDVDGRVTTVDGRVTTLIDGRIVPLETTVDQHGTAIDSLGDLATVQVPAQCQNPGSFCVLTTNGSTFVWQDIMM
jgi:hypothetical protein